MYISIRHNTSRFKADSLTFSTPYVRKRVNMTTRNAYCNEECRQIHDSYVAIFIVDVHDATVNSPFSAQYAPMDTNIHMVSAGSLTDTQPEFVETEQPKQSIRSLKSAYNCATSY